MALKTKAQYVASVRELGADVYMLGKRVPDVTRNGFTRLALEGIGGIYDLARDDRYKGLLTRREKGGPPYSAYCSIHSSREDLVDRVRAARLICQRTGVCTASRCCGWDALNALWHVTYEMDARHGTEYHKRLQRYVARVRGKDLTCAGALTDPKGNRALKPKHQPDKDVYVRVLEESRDGIVVRGAKAMIGGGGGREPRDHRPARHGLLGGGAGPRRRLRGPDGRGGRRPGREPPDGGRAEARRRVRHGERAGRVLREPRDLRRRLRAEGPGVHVRGARVRRGRGDEVRPAPPRDPGRVPRGMRGRPHGRGRAPRGVQRPLPPR